MSTNILKKRRTSVVTLMLTLASILLWGISTQSCSNEQLFDDNSFKSDENISEIVGITEVGIGDFKNWFNLQQIKSGLVEKKNLDLDSTEIKLMPDGKSKKITFIIYQGKNSLGNDSVRELHIAYVGNNFIGGIMAFSFNGKERALVDQYDFKDRLEREWEYYAPRKVFSLLKIYSIGRGQIRLKTRSEDDGQPCTFEVEPNTSTPLYFENGDPNPDAYNCHTYIWGPPQPSDPYYNITHDSIRPSWNNYPNIAGSGWSEVSTPQVGDRWVSFTHDIVFGENLPWHSAEIVEVIDGDVTKVRAKCGDAEIRIYDPDCDDYVGYFTNILKYYRES